MIRRRPLHRTPQSGYALLMVFAMAAILAIGLYQQLPRAAFEAQREKESLLIDHGQQYIRGVQLYCRKMGRYPAKMEDLDNTQNIRFLRKHYIDPMTGKDEWRLLHMGPNGKLADSKIESTDPNKDQFHQGSITEFKGPSTSDDGTPEGVNIAARHRQSDDQTLGPIGGNTPPLNQNPDPLAMNSPPSNSGNGTPGSSGAPPQKNAQSPFQGGALPGMPQGQRNLTLPNGTQVQSLPLTDPNASTATGGSGGFGSISGNGGFGSVSGGGGFGTSSPSTPAGAQPGAQPGGGPYGANSQFQGGSPAYPTAPGSNQPNNGGFGQPGQQTSPASMINALLTSPRPGGAPGSTLPGMGGTMVGGLAGVASTHKGHGIRHYLDQDQYQKWEFYYDYGAEMSGAGQATAATGAANPNGAANPANGTGSSFGNSSSFGNTSFPNSGPGSTNMTVGGAPAPPPPPTQPAQ